MRTKLNVTYEMPISPTHVSEFEETPRPKFRAAIVCYQSALRTLGAWLDANDATNISLVETSTGYVIRYCGCDNEMCLHRYILTHAELEHLEIRMKERRSIRSHGRYQDFLRALGYEMDMRSATLVLVDEIDENYYVACSLQTGGQGSGCSKVARVLSSADQAVILRRAYARRRSLNVQKGFWHRRSHGQEHRQTVRSA